MSGRFPPIPVQEALITVNVTTGVGSTQERVPSDAAPDPDRLTQTSTPSKGPRGAYPFIAISRNRDVDSIESPAGERRRRSQRMKKRAPRRLRYLKGETFCVYQHWP